MMNRVLIGLLLSLSLPTVHAWEDDYYVTEDDAMEAKSYNERADSLSADYDRDGTPNYLDPYDNEWTKDPAFRDFDNDGTPNYVDPYDNDWYKP